MRIGAGWVKHPTNGGDDFISIILDIPFLGSINMAVFKVKEKKNDNSPDFDVVWSKPRSGDSGTGSGGAF